MNSYTVLTGFDHYELENRMVMFCFVDYKYLKIDIKSYSKLSEF